MIHPVLLCGGSGTRLWPLSRKSYPKQFARLIGEDTAQITASAAVRRYLLAWLSFALAGLGFIWSLFDRRNRTWHDRGSGTRIVVLPKQPRR